MPGPVERWLETFMCKQYADVFEAYGYRTLQSVCQLSHQQLQSMGVAPDHCDKILENVSVLRQTMMAGTAKNTAPLPTSHPTPAECFVDPVTNPASSALISMSKTAGRGPMNQYFDSSRPTYLPDTNHLPYAQHTSQMFGQGSRPPGLADEKSLLYPQYSALQLGMGHQMHYPQPYQPPQSSIMSPPHPYGDQNSMYSAMHHSSQFPGQQGYHSSFSSPYGAPGSLASSIPPPPGSDSLLPTHGVHSHIRSPPSMTMGANPQQIADSIYHMASANYSSQTTKVPLSGSPYSNLGPVPMSRSPHYPPMMSGMPSPAHPNMRPGMQYGYPNASPMHAGSAGGSVGRASPNSVPVRSPASMHSNHSMRSGSPGPMQSPTVMRSPVPSPNVNHMRSPHHNQPVSSPVHPSMRSPAHPPGNSPMCPPGGPGPPVPPQQQAARSVVSPSHQGHYTSSSLSSPTQPNTNYTGISNISPATTPSSTHSSMAPTYNSIPPPSRSNMNTNPDTGQGLSSPLASLQKLVMLPETRVVDPKSVVNDACLPGENNSRDDPKNFLSGVGHSEQASLDMYYNMCSDGIHCGEAGGAYKRTAEHHSNNLTDKIAYGDSKDGGNKSSESTEGVPLSASVARRNAPLSPSRNGNSDDKKNSVGNIDSKEMPVNGTDINSSVNGPDESFSPQSKAKENRRKRINSGSSNASSVSNGAANDGQDETPKTKIPRKNSVGDDHESKKDKEKRQINNHQSAGVDGFSNGVVEEESKNMEGATVKETLDKNSAPVEKPKRKYRKKSDIAKAALNELQDQRPNLETLSAKQDSVKPVKKNKGGRPPGRKNTPKSKSTEQQKKQSVYDLNSGDDSDVELALKKVKSSKDSDEPSENDFLLFKVSSNMKTYERNPHEKLWRPPSTSEDDWKHLTHAENELHLNKKKSDESPGPKKRGRKRLSDEEKAERARLRRLQRKENPKNTPGRKKKKNDNSEIPKTMSKNKTLSDSKADIGGSEYDFQLSEESSEQKEMFTYGHKNKPLNSTPLPKRSPVPKLSVTENDTKPVTHSDNESDSDDDIPISFVKQRKLAKDSAKLKSSNTNISDRKKEKEKQIENTDGENKKDTSNSNSNSGKNKKSDSSQSNNNNSKNSGFTPKKPKSESSSKDTGDIGNPKTGSPTGSKGLGKEEDKGQRKDRSPADDNPCSGTDFKKPLPLDSPSTSTSTPNLDTSSNTPSIASSSTGAQSIKRKRGRPLGSKNSTKKTNIAKAKQKLKPGRKRKGDIFDFNSDNESFKTLSLNKTLDLVSGGKERKKKETNQIQGPYIRVKGSPTHPKSCQVVNNPGEDFSKTAKKNKVTHISIHGEAARAVTEKPAVVPSTTQEMNKDAEWMCSLCGKGTNHKNLGDLYGPYYAECSSPTKQIDSPKFHKKEKPGTSDHADEKEACRKKSKGASKSTEHWVHEDCVVWSDGVYLIGNKLHGLEDAVSVARQAVCSACKQTGATLGCFHKGCSQKFHYLCAVDRECQLDEENFSLVCPKHKDKKVKMVGEKR